MTNTLFTNVNILDGNAEGPIPGEVRVADGRIQPAGFSRSPRKTEGCPATARA